MKRTYLRATVILLGSLIGFGGWYVGQKIFAAGPLQFQPYESTLKENVFDIVYGSAKFTASQAPTASVQLTVNTDGQCLIRHSSNSFAHSSSYTMPTGSTESIIFQLRAIDDNTIEGNHACGISYTMSSDDPLYTAGGTARYPIKDNDATPGFTFLSKPTTVTEGGKSVIINYNSNDEFTHPVVFTYTVTAGCQVIDVQNDGSWAWVRSTTHQYAAGASGAIDVEIRAPDDNIAQGNRTCTFTGKTATADPNYNGLSLPSHTLTIIDNDTKKPAPSAPSPQRATPAPAPATTQNATTVGDILRASQKGAVKLSQLAVAGKALREADTVAVPQDQTLELVGTTVPHGKIMLHIFSEPQTATVAADGQGNWRYQILGLPQGEHHIEAEVTDPTTGATTPRQNLLAFAVTTPVTNTPLYPMSGKTDRTSRLWYIPLVTLVFMIGAAIYGVKYHPKGRRPKPKRRSN